MKRLLVIALIILAAACGRQGDKQGEGAVKEAPELLLAVPSDALAVGVFTRLDHALEQMLDPSDVLLELDYSKFARNRACIALCNVGSIVPLVIIETGRAHPGTGLRPAADTLAQTAALAARADSLRLSSAQLALPKHNVLLISPSATIITVVRRHLLSDSSILDAPYFDGVLEIIGGSDGIAWRNSGARRLLRFEACSIPRNQLVSFIKEATEWTVACDGKLRTVQPESERYFCNFLATCAEGESKLGSFFPDEAELVIDMPIADLKQWRASYETFMDARVELEAYNKRIQNLRKSSGKNPLDWEKELGIQEVAYAATPEYTLNLVRCADKGKSEGVLRNPAAGFVRALYGEPFNATDTCCIRKGKWIVSGPREVLDTLSFGKERNWPVKSVAVVQSENRRLTWTKENNILWQVSNR